jgi:hypothetical protein
MLSTSRKQVVIPSGKGLRLTLPSVWTEAEKVKKGDRVELLISKGILILPEQTLTIKEAEEMMNDFKVLLELKMRKDGKI